MKTNDHYENGCMLYSMWVYTVYYHTRQKNSASRFFPNSVGPDRAPYLLRVIWAHIVCLCAMYGTKVEKKSSHFGQRKWVMTRVGFSRVWHFIQVCTICPDEKEAIGDEVAVYVAIGMPLASNRLLYQVLDGSSYLIR